MYIKIEQNNKVAELQHVNMNYKKFDLFRNHF